MLLDSHWLGLAFETIGLYQFWRKLFGIWILWNYAFFNKYYSLLNFDRSQLYNSETLPFTYYQYVAVELGDKLIQLADELYNSVNVCFCVSPWIFIQINNFSKLPGSNHWPLDYKASALPLHHGGPTSLETYYACTKQNKSKYVVIWGILHSYSCLLKVLSQFCKIWNAHSLQLHVMKYMKRSTKWANNFNLLPNF